MINKDIQESKWVTEFKNGNEDTFEELFNRYKRKLYFFALSYLDDNAEAEEIVQSVFVRLWENRSKLDETMSVRNFIYKSTVNACYNSLKRKAIRTRYVENELSAFDDNLDCSYDKIYYHDLKRKIDSIIDTLPPQQKKNILFESF